MSDPRTAQGAIKMFPGTVGGNARPAQPVTRPRPRPVRWVVPVSPPLVYGESATHDYCTATLGPLPSQWDDVRQMNPPIHVAAGITYDTPIGFPLPVEPFAWTTYYSNDVVHWFMPAAVNVRVTVNFWFSETETAPPYDTETEDRQLRIRLILDSDSSVIADESATFTGERYGPVEAQFSIGPYTITEPWTIYTYCLWTTVHSGAAGAHNMNVYPGNDGILITGILL